MYKNFYMTQLTLLLETSVLIPTNNMSRCVNKIKVDNENTYFKSILQMV